MLFSAFSRDVLYIDVDITSPPITLRMGNGDSLAPTTLKIPTFGGGLEGMLRKDTTVPHPTIFFKTDIFCTTLMALGHEQLLDAFQLFWKLRVALSKSSGETRILFHRNIGGNSQCNSGGTPNEKVSLLAILGDLFGMVK